MRFPMKMIVVIVLCMAGVLPAQTSRPSEESLGNGALAERLSQLGQTTLATKSITPATLRQSIALFEAASQLNPKEVRFLRLLTEANLQLGGQEGRDGAIAALTKYRELQPADLAAQIQLIDLYFTRQETAVDRKEYIEKLLAAPSLAAEVRSHVALMAAQLSEDRAEVEQSKVYVQQAIDLMPLNTDALRMKYRQLPDDAVPAKRVGLLIQMLRANPAQPGVMTELATELAEAGMVDPSMFWYAQSYSLQTKLGLQPRLDEMTAYTAELVIADQVTAADAAVRRLLELDAANAEAGFLGVLVAKRSADAEKILAATDKARSALLGSLSRLSDQLNERNNATTQPSPDVDIPGDVKKLAESPNADLKAAYAAGLADLVWLDIYFNNKPADAQQYLTALRQLVPADSAIIARLEGWAFLVDSKNAEARVKLSAVADRDPLAELGMLRIENDMPAPQFNAAAKKLLNNNASGLIGAILIEALRSKIGLMPARDDANEIRAELDKMPRDWLDILDFQRTQSFYSFKAEPLKVAHAYGEPILMQITLTNTCNYDLTVGPNGIIHPDLWFDVNIRGVAIQTIPGVAFDRIGQKLLLKPKESISTIVRVDQGQLAAIMQGNPNIGMPLFFFVFTNPLTQQAGVAPGPGGYRVSARVVERGSTPTNPQVLQSLAGQLQGATADTRVRLLELLGAFASGMMRSPDPATKAKGTEVADVIRRSTGDPVPAVRALATATTAALSDDAVREGILRQMLIDPAMPVRVMGLAALQLKAENEQVKTLAQPMADSDANPIVRKLAGAMIEVANMPRPTTQESPAADAK